MKDSGGRRATRFGGAGRLGVAAAALALLLPGTAAAQAAIAVGQTLRGALESGDPTLDDGSHYRCYRLQTQPGTRYRVELKSDAFDAYLGIGKRCDDASETDDDGAGGSNARIDFTGDGETWLIRANSLTEGETGPFVLSVYDRGPAPVVRTNAIAFGQSLQGALESTDAVAEDDSYFDCYVFTGRANQPVVVEMRSSDFDAYTSLYPGGGCSGEQLAGDDDSAGGTDPRLETTLPSSGAYSIRANSLGSEEVGAYLITLTGEAEPAREADSEAQRTFPPVMTYFEARSDVLNDQARETLAEVARQIGSAGDLDVTVAAHADPAEGSVDFVVGLSQRRANAVREYLVGLGVPSGVITTQAFGASRPVSDASKSLPDNRRAEISAGPGSGW